MLELNLPPIQPRLVNDSVGVKIFDRLRKKFVLLTPEEWVRQHFVEYMIVHKGYPEGLMGNEVALTLNGTKRRSDTVVFDRNRRPLVIVEYKAPSVKLTQEVFDQIVRYNMVLHAPLLIVSNGLRHYCCMVDYKNCQVRFLADIPEYVELNTSPNDF